MNSTGLFPGTVLNTKTIIYQSWFTGSARDETSSCDELSFKLDTAPKITLKNLPSTAVLVSAKIGGISMTNKQSKNRNLWLGGGSAFLALLAGAGCCGLPIVSTILASVGVSSTFFASLKPLQPLFIGIAIAVLAYEFYKAYRKTPDSAKCCDSARKVRLTILWLVTLIMSALLTIQYVKNQNAKISQNSSTKQNRYLDCSGCGKTDTKQNRQPKPPVKQNSCCGCL